MRFCKTFWQALILFPIGLIVAGCDTGSQSAQSKIDKLAFEMNSKLPVMLDSDTKLVNVHTKNLELISEYELVNYQGSEPSKSALKGKLENYLKTQVCSNIKSELLSKGISSRYIYKTNTGAVVLDLVLTKNDC
jgi:hypothetical protein